MRKICLCSGRKFYEKLWEVKRELEKLGYDVLLPSMKDFDKDIKDGFLIQEGKKIEFAKIQHDLIKNHFGKINNSTAILVCNFDKDGIKNYIGINVLMDMAKAFDKGIPIFLLNPPPEINYKSEILAMQPIVLKNLQEIKKYLEK